MQTYTPPDVRGPVSDVVPEGHRANALTAETVVTFIHRGRHILRDQYDATQFEIRPGIHRGPYGLVKHLKDRAVIPGTRVPTGEITQQQSYIGILNLDSDEDCQPLTDAQVAKFGAAVEALDRTTGDPEDKNIHTIRTGVTGPISGGRRGRRGPDLSEQATEEARLRAGEALQPPAESDAQRDGREARGARPARGGRTR